MLTLYSYWRSSAAYRVRIALHYKGIEFDTQSVHLVQDGGQQHSDAYQQLNPSQLIPTLKDGDLVIGQSMAILQYLEERYPQSPLLPDDIVKRAHIQSFALDIACDIHPLNNLRVLQHLTAEFKNNDDQNQQWYRHWLATGFKVLEEKLRRHGGLFCYGDQPTLADVVLVPQVYNAHRYELGMDDFPFIQSVYERCNDIEAFALAAPEVQPDAP